MAQIEPGYTQSEWDHGCRRVVELIKNNPMMNDIERGDRARDVLENPVYIEAFEAIEKELTASWKQAKSTDERESLWLEQKLLSKVQTLLLIALQTGKLAKQKQSLPQRVTDLVRRSAGGLS